MKRFVLLSIIGLSCVFIKAGSISKEKKQTILTNILLRRQLKDTVGKRGPKTRGKKSYDKFMTGLSRNGYFEYGKQNALMKGMLFCLADKKWKPQEIFIVGKTLWKTISNS